MKSDAEPPSRLPLLIIAVFLALIAVSIFLPSLGDETIRATRTSDITAIARQINANGVTEINQRDDGQTIIVLQNGELWLFSRPPNATMTDLLQGAGVDPATINHLNFTSGVPPNPLWPIANVLQLISLGGLGGTLVFTYAQRRRRRS